METYSSDFLPQIEIYLFSKKCSYREDEASSKTAMQKTELEKSLFFNQMSSEYKETKLH